MPDFGGATSELQQAIVEAFREGNIAAPVPQREIRTVASTAYVGRKEAAAQLGSG